MIDDFLRNENEIEARAEKTGNSMRTRSIFVDISADLFNEYLGSMKKLEFATDDVYVARFLSS